MMNSNWNTYGTQTNTTRNNVTRNDFTSDVGVGKNEYLAAFLLDGSGSTSRPVLGSNKSIWTHECEALIDAIVSLRTSHMVSKNLRVTVRVFAGSEVKTILPLTLISDIDIDLLKKTLAGITPYDMTPLGKAIRGAVQDLMNTRAQLVATSHTVGYPVVTVITDGLGNDPEDFNEAVALVDTLLDRPNGKPHLNLIPIGFAGSEAERSFPQLERLIEKDPGNECGVINSGRGFHQVVHLIEMTQVAVERGTKKPTLRDIQRMEEDEDAFAPVSSDAPVYKSWNTVQTPHNKGGFTPTRPATPRRVDPAPSRSGGPRNIVSQEQFGKRR